MVQVSAAEQASAKAPSDTELTYTVTLLARDEVDLKGSKLSLTVVSESDASQQSEKLDITAFRAESYQPHNPHKSGTKFSGHITLPKALQPGVIILRLENAEGNSAGRPLYLRKLVLEAKSQSSLEYLANSYIDHSQGDRFIFPSKAMTPATTPEGIRPFRQKDLDDLKGGSKNKEKMQGADRAYEFEVYNDLGKPAAGKIRPTLGASKEFPFPRRIRTARGVDGEGFEQRIPDDAGILPWVPIDERFTLIKERTFEGLNKYSAGAVASSPQGFVKAVVGLRTLQKNLVTSEFPDLAAIDAMYDDLKQTEQMPGSNALRDTNRTDILHSVAHWLDGVEDKLSASAQTVIEKLMKLKREHSKKDQKQPQPDPADLEGSLEPEEAKVLGVVQFLSGIIHRWPVPNVRKGRKALWHTDEEFGRQVMEGQNPLVIRAMTQQDLQDFAVQDKDVEGLLEGQSLSQRISEGARVFVLDFHTHFNQFVKQVNSLPGPNNKQRVMYAGRCVLYSRNDRALVPVAIELETEGVPLTVYTPKHSAQLWRLAKTVICSVETWHHQAIVHLLQTHLCVEPYIIATRRSLSIMHPINKLLQPAFRWTMRPNADARQNLISADGIIETAFTPGSLSMQIISKIYGADWRFDTQGLPDDLIARGVAKQGQKGLEITLPGYSYAEDALLIFNALEKWVGEYVALYYSDNGDGKKVTEDAELTSWWTCIRKEGHPDKLEGWPELADTKSLTKILTAIMWTAGPHHAAVNYGQYQYSGFMPNRPSMIRKKIPLPNSKEEKTLTDNFEKELMQTISDPLSTATLMLMTKLLSHHSADEEFINSPEHSWIRDAEALDLYGEFVKSLNSSEAEIGRRNKSEERLRGGNGLPYTQMMPSVDPSTLPESAHGDIGYQVSYRGIPNSIAI